MSQYVERSIESWLLNVHILIINNTRAQLHLRHALDVIGSATNRTNKQGSHVQHPHLLIAFIAIKRCGNVPN